MNEEKALIVLLFHKLGFIRLGPNDSFGQLRCRKILVEHEVDQRNLRLTVTSISMAIVSLSGCTGNSPEFAAVSGQVDAASPGTNIPFKDTMDDNERTVLEAWTLAVGESKRFEVESSSPIRIGFEAQVTREMFEKYKPTEHLIRIEQSNDGNHVQSFAGASTIFSPVDGRVEFDVKNISKDDISLKVFTEPVD